MTEETKELLVKIFMYWSMGVCMVGLLEVINLIKNEIKEVSKGKIMSLLICMILSWITFIILISHKIIMYAKKKKKLV